MGYLHAASRSPSYLLSGPSLALDVTEYRRASQQVSCESSIPLKILFKKALFSSSFQLPKIIFPYNESLSL